MVGDVRRARFTKANVWIGCQTRPVPGEGVSKLRLIEQLLSARDEIKATLSHVRDVPV